MSEEKYKLSMIVYDGINFFKNGEWTMLEFDSVDEGRHIIGFLETLTNEQVDHWIRVQTYLKGSNKTFNALKHNTKYSGETTDHATVSMVQDKWKENPGAGLDCIRAVNYFDVQWSNCPVEVEKEVKQIWRDYELGNDNYFFKWGDYDDEEETYPVVAEYLKSRGIEKCHIHWWW